MDADFGLDVMVAVGLFGDLQAQTIVVDAIVAADDTTFLDAEDFWQVADEWNEGCVFLGRLDGEGSIVGRDEDVPQVLVGSLPGVNSCQPQFLGQTFWMVPKARSIRPLPSGE